MTSKNNFNCNSDGPNIEFDGCIDNFQSQTDWTENFETIVQESYQKTAIHFYNPGGQIEQNLDLKITILKKDLYKFVEEYCTDYIDKTWLKSELMSQAIEFLDEELTAYKYDIDELATAYNIKVAFVNDIDVVVTRGYSQGDYALIIIDKTQLLKLWGNFVYEVEKTTIDHFMWDSPVWARLTINEVEYQYHDYDLEPYEWQRDEFIQHVAKAANVQVTDLEELVPSELGYSN